MFSPLLNVYSMIDKMLCIDAWGCKTHKTLKLHKVDQFSMWIYRKYQQSGLINKLLIKPNSAVLLNVAWMRGGTMCPHLLDHPKILWKTKKKILFSRNFGLPDPFFHGEIAF